MYVTDLDHITGLEFALEAPAPARRLAEHFTAIVRAATAAPCPSGRRIAVPCRRRPGRQPCPGPVITSVSVADPAVLWECLSCQDGGCISGWQGTSYDLTPDASEDEPGIAVVIPTAAYRSLLTGELFDREAERVIYAAEPVTKGVELCATEADWDNLLGCLAADANHSPPHRRRQLDTALQRIEQGLASMRRARPRAARREGVPARAGGPRRASSSSVQVPELTALAAQREVAAYCDRRIPLGAGDQVRLEVEDRDASLTIVERRVPFQADGPVHPSDWTRLPIAQLRWSDEDHLWRLHWCDRRQRWRLDVQVAPAPNVEVLLAHLDADPLALYWG